MKILLIVFSLLLIPLSPCWADGGITLDFSDCRYTDTEGSPRSRSIANKVQNILTSEEAEDIERISFSTNIIGDKGVPALCHLTGLPKLKVLDLSYNVITEEGVPGLVPLLRCPHIEYVDIVENNATLFESIGTFLRGIRAVTTSDEEHLLLTSKLVFVNQSWFDFKEARAVLDPLVEQRLLPSNWLGLHRTYYSKYQPD